MDNSLTLARSPEIIASVRAEAEDVYTTYGDEPNMHAWVEHAIAVEDVLAWAVDGKILTPFTHRMSDEVSDWKLGIAPNALTVFCEMEYIEKALYPFRSNLPTITTTISRNHLSGMLSACLWIVGIHSLIYVPL